MLQSALPALGLLLLMVLLAFALQRWKKHLPGVGRAGGPALRVMHSVALGPQQRLVTVQVGEGADAVCLVLGVAPGNISHLHSQPMPTQQPHPADTAPAAAPGATTAGAFASRLSQLMKPSAKGPHDPR